MTNEYGSNKRPNRYILSFIFISIFALTWSTHADFKYYENFDMYNSLMKMEPNPILATSVNSNWDDCDQQPLINNLGYNLYNNCVHDENINLTYRWQVFDTMYIELYYPLSRHDLMFAVLPECSHPAALNEWKC